MVLWDDIKSILSKLFAKITEGLSKICGKALKWAYKRITSGLSWIWTNINVYFKKTIEALAKQLRYILDSIKDMDPVPR